MKTAEQILEFIPERIGHIYFRPLMYSGNAENLDTILHYYHELWAMICDCEELYQSVSRKVHEKQRTGAVGFATRYGMKHPSASEDEKAEYAAHHWQKISKGIGMKIPYKKLRESFQHTEHLKNKFADEQ